MDKITRQSLTLYQLAQENDKLKKDISAFRNRLMSFCDLIEQKNELKYTGWFVLLKRDGDEWVSLCVFNPDISDEDAEPEWDICLPIPTVESMSEFVGW